MRMNLTRHLSLRTIGACLLVFPLLVVQGIFLGCAGSNPESDIQTDGLQGLASTATFAGVIPCTDCEGIRMTVRLLEDRTFLLRRVYFGTMDGREQTRYDLGTWSISEDGRKITLDDGSDAPLAFAVEEGRSLQMLDRNGRRIPAHLNYKLIRSAASPPAGESFPMRGMFAYLADVARFTDCGSGQQFPVLMEGDFDSVVQSYLQTQQAPGEPLMVTFDGHLDVRTGENDNQKTAAVIIDVFDGIWPDDRCEEKRGSALPGSVVPP